MRTIRFNQTNLRIIGIPEESEGWGAESLFLKITGNFPNLVPLPS